MCRSDGVVVIRLLKVGEVDNFRLFWVLRAGVGGVGRLGGMLDIWLVGVLFRDRGVTKSVLLGFESYLPLHRYTRMRNQQKLARDISCNTACRGDHYKLRMKK
ncbi:hypothetical protein Tco_0351312 [Tanacetum coccineum]